MARYKTERESIEICIEFLRVQKKKKKKKNTLISIHAFFPSIKYLISIEDHFPNSSQGEEKILGSNSRDFIIIIIIPKMHTDRIGRNSNFLYTHTHTNVFQEVFVDSIPLLVGDLSRLLLFTVCCWALEI